MVCFNDGVWWEYISVRFLAQHFLLQLVQTRSHWRHYMRLFWVELQPSWLSLSFQQRQKLFISCLCSPEILYFEVYNLYYLYPRAVLIFPDTWGCLLAVTVQGWTLQTVRPQWWLSLLYRFCSWLSCNTPR